MTAYGFVFAGLEPHELLALDHTVDWPVVEVFVRTSATSPIPDLGPKTFEIDLPVGKLQFTQDVPYRAVYTLSENVTHEALIHPNLQPVASILARMRGLEVLHAGGFLVDGEFWGVVGDRGAGKSTILASLAARGFDVLSDDLLVIDGSTAFAGPRVIGLRPDVSIPIPGLSSNKTLALSKSLPAIPITGWLVLGWSVSHHCRMLNQQQLRYELHRHQSRPELARLSADLRPELVSLRSWRISRPLTWSSHDPTIETILKCVTSPTTANAGVKFA